MVAGLIAGGWLASAVISKLTIELVEYNKINEKKLGLKAELARLEKGLPRIRAVMEGVDQCQIKEVNKPMETWLWQLRDAADQADDVMDEMEYYLVKEKVEATNKVSAVKVFLELVAETNPTLKKLRKVVKAMDEVVGDVEKFYMIVHDLVEIHKAKVIENRQTSSVLNVGFKPYGLVEEKHYIISKLLNPERKRKEVNFSVLPIIGAGGIGKTTLAQLVYDDLLVKDHFKLRLWVCMSTNFDVVFLTKKLYESVHGRRADFDSLDLIQRKVAEVLRYKKFLVVFDDAWNDNNRQGWEQLLAPLKFGEAGSMILLTTRLRAVSRFIGPNVMDSVVLKGLNEHDMWDLFEEYAFGGEDPSDHEELVETGREIVKKLDGVPLAAKSVGGILCTNLCEDYWRSVSRSELWSLKQGPNDIMPALRLAYQHLPLHLKPCFSFCSIFPQDHIFIKDDLINMWVALGLVPRDFHGAKRPEDAGSEYFQDMLNRSIFSPANPVRNAHLRYPAYTYNSITRHKFVEGYIMHDLMHDLSTSVSQGECFTYYTDKLECIPTTVRHLYVRVCTCCELNNNFNLENIRTLVLHFEDFDHPKLDYIVNEVVNRSRSLRILAVFALKLSEFPKSASDLLHLRYLSLSSFKITGFPRSISKLYFLETMVCGGFGFEEQIHVAGLVDLINMRHLIVSEDFVETIAGLGRLTSLQELSCRVGKSSRFKICELEDMRDLRRLSISNVGGIASYEEAIGANLGNKVSLSNLSLQWGTDNLDKKVFEHLEPHCNLKELKIRNYMDESLPPWLTKQAFSNMEALTFESLGILEEWSLTEEPYNRMCCLRELTIDDCPKLMVLPSLPASLKKLKLQGLGFFYLPDLLKDDTSEPESLPSLVSMEISDCPNLASLAKGFLQNPEQFTSLEELIIMNCGKLETPPDGFSKYMSLKRLDISDCPEIKLSFVHKFSLSSTLQFFRTDNYVEDIQVEMKREDNAHELHLQSVPTLQTEEAKLVLFDLSQPIFNWKLRISSMRSYMGRWSRAWLTQNLSHLEYLNIDGYPQSEEYCSEKLPEEINQLLNFICQEGSNRSTPEVEQIYVVTEHIKCMQCLKRLSVDLRSNSLVMPHFPDTLKELTVSNLGLSDLQSFWQNPSNQRRSLPSLVKIEISDCPNLSHLGNRLLEQFAGLKQLIISNCRKLEMPPKGFRDFISLERLDVRDCPKIKQSFQDEVSYPNILPFLPSTLQFLCTYLKDIQSENRKKMNWQLLSIFHKKEMRENNIIYESSLQTGSTLQTNEMELLVWGSLELELRFPNSIEYTGRWPPVWLCTPTLSMLESLCIDGNPSNLNIFHHDKLPFEMKPLLPIIKQPRIFRDWYPSLEIANPSDMTVLKQSYLAMQHNKLPQFLEKLTIALCSTSCFMPPLSITLKILKLHHLGLVVLPNLYENKSSDSGSLPSLVSMEITDCPNLVSLAEGLFQEPQQFAALEKLKIWDCRMLRELPQGGFSKFISLKELDIGACPKIKGQLVPECFLPSTLQVLHVSNCGDLGATLTKALESVQSLISLELYRCKNIRSLPPKEVFSRWKTLERLEFAWCFELTSLESLLCLSSVRLLKIRFCFKLVSSITSPSAGKKDEIEAARQIQTSSRPASTQPTPTDPCSSTNTERKPLLSVDELIIDDPLLLSIEPIRSLSSVRKLTITWCSVIQSLPELPPILEELSLKRCSPELQRRCEESGEDWPKLSHIPKVYISDFYY